MVFKKERKNNTYNRMVKILGFNASTCVKWIEKSLYCSHPTNASIKKCTDAWFWVFVCDSSRRNERWDEVEIQNSTMTFIIIYLVLNRPKKRDKRNWSRRIVSRVWAFFFHWLDDNQYCTYCRNRRITVIVLFFWAGGTQ